MDLNAFHLIFFCAHAMCLKGHVDEMWGLATHSYQNIFLTCGHDRQVCLWHTEEHKLDWCITLEVGPAAPGLSIICYVYSRIHTD